MIAFIGDLHGKISDYFRLLNRLPEEMASVAIGDIGLGFAGVAIPKIDLRHRFFHGNHDDPVLFKAHPNDLGRYGQWNGVFFVAGAFSIDVQWRTPGVSWWADEQLSRKEMDQALDLYKLVKPRVVATHDAPRSLYPRLMTGVGARGPIYENATAHFLEEMFNIHQPDWWIAGHWHRSLRFQIGKTNFVILNELEVFELDVERINTQSTEAT